MHRGGYNRRTPMKVKEGKVQRKNRHHRTSSPGSVTLMRSWPSELMRPPSSAPTWLENIKSPSTNPSLSQDIGYLLGAAAKYQPALEMMLPACLVPNPKLNAVPLAHRLRSQLTRLKLCASVTVPKLDDIIPPQPRFREKQPLINSLVGNHEPRRQQSQRIQKEADCDSNENPSNHRRPTLRSNHREKAKRCNCTERKQREHPSWASECHGAHGDA